MNTHTNRQIEIPSLTGLRFFAALFVCVAHAVPRFYINGTASIICKVMTELSAEGMTLFFVLSGFVIHYNYSKALRQDPKVGMFNFFMARIARLWPLYLMCLCVDFIMNGSRLLSLPAHFFEAIPYYLTLTQSWFYLPMGGHALIYQFGSMPSIAWSVSTEWFFYICYPLICLIIMKAPTIRTKLLALAIVAILSITTIAILAMNNLAINDYAIKAFGMVADSTINSDDSFFRWLIYISPYSRISEFIVGSLVAAILMQLSANQPSKQEERLGFIATILILISIIATHYFIFYMPSSGRLSWIINMHECFGFALSFAALIFCCARYRNIVTRFLCKPFVLLGGEISYSFYLLHPIVIGFWVRALAKINVYDYIKVSITLASIFVVAIFSYRMIESPSRRLLRKWLMIPANQRRCCINAS